MTDGKVKVERNYYPYFTPNYSNGEIPKDGHIVDIDD